MFAQARLESVAKTFDVARPMVCEHVGLRVRSNHSRRGDLRITLVSPSGTRSVLQRRNFDSEPGPVDWTYWSTQHFYEPSPGRWRAEFGDEVASVEGEILATDLILRGVDILDSDADGLDDAWERRWFGNLGGKATDDADRDGSSSAREQVLGTDPTRADEPFRITMNTFDRTSFRLSWPTVDGAEYRVLRRGLVDGVSVLESTVAGRYPERDWVVPGEALPGATYRIERVSP
ncbi:MAG: proprotein convertase P-domain-containing protein [Verrucomicrobiales bacterium]|nr:proprotein convertase P-domain-containing protein [Verrucomicrobiales bacterium]